MKTFTRLLIALFCLGFAISGNAKIDEETILGIWLFDEDIDKTVKDASGNGHWPAATRWRPDTRSRLGPP
ncbi:MAG: hypothetical protein OXH00_00895, partial [Candidatus Poribacteria bacterium]|nr:hypothetical protein [Candidatus Poribacteria bacterium]